MIQKISKVVALTTLSLLTTASPSSAADPVLVTVDTFIRAESDMYFDNVVKQVGVGRFHHSRDPLPIDRQTVIRGNRDTLYSSAVFDLDAGPVTITLPDSGKRYMSLQTISEDHYTTTVYGAGKYELDKNKVGTRYVMVGIRTLVNPEDSEDVRQVHALQDGIKVSQPSALGSFDIPA
jgi:hypothetical protein